MFNLSGYVMVQYLKCTLSVWGDVRSFLQQTLSSLHKGYITEVSVYVGIEDVYDQVCTGESI
jgi:hypothetical protein